MKTETDPGDPAPGGEGSGGEYAKTDTRKRKRICFGAGQGGENGFLKMDTRKQKRIWTPWLQGWGATNTRKRISKTETDLAWSWAGRENGHCS